MKRVLIIVGMVGVAAAGLWWRFHWENRFDPQIRTAAARYNLPPSLVKAVVWKESRFNPDARGKVGEIGLMQVTENAAQEWADASRVAGYEHDHTLDPGTNTLAGCHYLAKVLKRYSQTDNPLAYALADYNAGRGNVLRWMNSTNAPAAKTNSIAFLTVMTFPGTRQYVQDILERRKHYESVVFTRP